MHRQTFKKANYYRMERWSDSAGMKRFLKRERHRAERRDGHALINESESA